ncbi:MAG: DUF123 domain-containing protein [Desulfurococcaceae archaeon]
MNHWDCYILVLKVKSHIEILLANKIVKVIPNLYLYVGSSKGPGGALARISRHLSKEKSLKWHIDALTANYCVEILGCLLIKSKCSDCEVEIAKQLALNFNYIPKFGCTDKSISVSHLFQCSDLPEQCIYRAYNLAEENSCTEDMVYVESY